MCATVAMDFFQRGIGSQFGAWLGGHFANPVALNAAIVLLSIASTMVFLVPAARDKLTKAKVEHKRLTLEIKRHGRAYYQDDASKTSTAEYEALRLRVNAHRGAVFRNLSRYWISALPRITDSSRTSRHVGKVPEPEVGVASENHRQAVRQERPILIHTASAALLSLGTFHPSIIKTSWPAGVSGAGSCTGSRSSAGARAIDVAPATKALRSIIMPLSPPDFSIDVFAAPTTKKRKPGLIAWRPRTEVRRRLQHHRQKLQCGGLVRAHAAWADCRH